MNIINKYYESYYIPPLFSKLEQHCIALALKIRMSEGVSSYVRRLSNPIFTLSGKVVTRSVGIEECNSLNLRNPLWILGGSIL